MKFICLILTILALVAAKVSSIKPIQLFAPVPFYPDIANFHSGRIIGGEEAIRGQFPYQVGIEIYIGDKEGWCGGSIISDEWILTAAHCTESADSVTVFIGAHNITENDSNTLKIKVGKDNIIVHEQWSKANDISLIRLPQKLQFNDLVQPVNLPTKTQASESFVDKIAIASGWGIETDESESLSSVLRFVELPIISQLACNIYFFGRIKSTHICANGGRRKSPCSGDSGGPLVLTEEDKSKTLLGITSFGFSLSCEIGWPGVFTRTTLFLEWIHSKTGIPIRE